MSRHQAASARGRKQTGTRTRMEHRDRAAAASTNGLLNRQFASITDVLVKASQRRNAELQELQQRRSRPVPIPSTPKAAPELPVTPEPELSQGSDSCDDRPELEQAYKSDENTASDEPMAAASVEGSSDMQQTQVHLRGGYLSDRAENPKMMLAELDSSLRQRSDIGNKEKLDGDYDLSRMLADMKRDLFSSKDTVVVRDNSLKATGADLSLNKEDELSALAERLGVDIGEDDIMENKEAMPAESGEEKKIPDTNCSNDEDDNLETLRAKMNAMFSPPSNMTPDSSRRTAQAVSVVDKTLVSPQDTTAILEPKGIQRPDMNESEAKKEKEDMVRRENEKLDATIKYVLEEEEKYHATEEKKILPYRLIVTNLAASVDEEAIRILFIEYRWDIRNITILPEREPVKRTRTAYIDMDSRKEAIRASYEVGSIYGLIVKIKLAVE
ncbi:uncharacterized protein J4E84_003766 [Alternaria hordeiaustralica]|uniref:uncharacterized protein n=1 Tax=Alternaria hordeiaustralica TaxID=1187925 RepID=UPI0020C2FC2F|nr:uncharacterized protein J4E84_003766 [Alternaria hordeiaustralica]KAI4691472.1 hypothetical protein J4E84_003766 [Alternaria hordeiaustralica]